MVPWCRVHRSFHFNVAERHLYLQMLHRFAAGSQYNLLPNLELSLSGNNLLNQTYETIRHYTMPGINGSAGLSYRF